MTELELGKVIKQRQRADARRKKSEAKAAVEALVDQTKDGSIAVAIPTPPETVGDTGMTMEQIKAVPLVSDPAEIAKLTPDDLRRQILVRAAIDMAATEHHKAEAETGMVLPRPEIMRRTNEKAAKVLLNQLDHVNAEAGATRFTAMNPTAANLKKYVPESEARATGEMLAKIPELRDRQRQEADDKERAKTHVNGDTLWVCESNPDAKCYAKTFRGASLDVVRRKAAAEPGWIFACPHCRGTRIRLADIREGVAA